MTQPISPVPGLPDFSRCRVLVAGDVMLDRYWRGATSRVSPEAPVPVVRFDALEERPGGAANVAANLALLGVQTRLVGVIGEDAEGDALVRLLTARGIDFHAIRAAGAPTTTKQRIVSRNQQLIRLDTERPVPAEAARALAAALPALSDGVDLLVLSDYAKGALGEVQTLIAAARARGIPVLVDPKGRDFERYRGASLLTPNLGEFEQVAGACGGDEDALVDAARRLAVGLGLEHLLVTRSERGMSLVPAQGPAAHLPTRAREVFDVTGAGDTVIATMAAALAAGLAPVTAAQLANAAAGLVVRRLGVAGVTPAELADAAAEAGVLVATAGGAGAGLLRCAEQAREVVSAARARGERVVMTNGCFDVLHAGHVAYLQQARALGARLLVALNDDASVRRLKGPPRPINSLEDRAAVLLALAAVDWVVPFAADTPRELICSVLPDVLVKGGDYRVEEIAGADCVKQAGGEVLVLPLLPGRSTTATLDRLRGG